MSRCIACNCILTPQESTRRFKGSGTFTELCNRCLHTISDDVQTVEGNVPDEESEYEE